MVEATVRSCQSISVLINTEMGERAAAEASLHTCHLRFHQSDGICYLLQIVIPNVYFHVAMAYAILRANGVDLGKRDFIGPVNSFDA